MAQASFRVHYVIAVARALTAHGGSATPHQVYDWIARNGLRRPQLPPEGVDPEEHYEREIRFARQELRYGGLLISRQKSWHVTDENGMLALTPDAVQRMISQNRRNRRGSGASPLPETPEGVDSTLSRLPAATTGPRPTEWVGESRRTDGPAKTYVLRFGNTDLWKIGFASDVRSRLTAINRHVPVEIVDGRWELANTCSWPNQLTAYAMEQEVLSILIAERTIYERVRCSPERLKAAWDRARAAIARQQPAGGSTAADKSNFSTRARPKASRLPTTR